MTGAHSAPVGHDPVGHDPLGAGAPAGHDDPPSIGELLSDVSRDLSTLVRQELELAKAEATQTATRVGKGSGLLVGAALAGFFVLMFLSIAAWWAIGNSTGHGWSALIVTLIWAVIGAILGVLGRSSIRRARGLPRTQQTVSEIPQAVTPHPQENR
ncbi:phage holin family protein [Williamsia deligens]|uniref:Phage holin family protein n=1 Tax=Williamsia deligens TaxID=321325 RepID=A0ABW3G428_9NOCA|nr:phage holin family protein [Williamsia deligens]MCP2194482.1 putative Holin-X, holin superfamily III [Williamsia deligens]